MKPSLESINCLIDQCDSTNDLARNAAEKGAAHGSWISSRIQTSGRGRQGRKWVSKGDGLYLSIILVPPLNFQFLQWVPLSVAVGTLSAIKNLSDDPITIKWPNDLWVSGKKLGGILCEGSQGQSPWVVAGIGINCKQAPDPEELQRPACYLKVSADQIRMPIIQSVLWTIDELFKNGPDRVREEFIRNSAIQKGDALIWKDLATGLACEGVFQDLLATAELSVRVSNRNQIHLNSEEIISVKKRN